ncbi:hypothetical protein [Arthrobacter woluwensis]|uniref:hypothetical protein n=1 Tax=Arthrobacter woluwensis TaxID=156980 RepID=UPI003803F5D2
MVPALSSSASSALIKESGTEPVSAEAVSEGSSVLVQTLTVLGLLGAGFLYFRVLRSRGTSLRRSQGGRL